MEIMEFYRYYMEEIMSTFDNLQIVIGTDVANLLKLNLFTIYDYLIFLSSSLTDEWFDAVYIHQWKCGNIMNEMIIMIYLPATSVVGSFCDSRWSATIREMEKAGLPGSTVIDIVPLAPLSNKAIYNEEISKVAETPEAREYIRLMISHQRELQRLISNCPTYESVIYRGGASATKVFPVNESIEECDFCELSLTECGELVLTGPHLGAHLMNRGATIKQAKYTMSIIAAAQSILQTNGLDNMEVFTSQLKQKLDLKHKSDIQRYSDNVKRVRDLFSSVMGTDVIKIVKDTIAGFFYFDLKFNFKIVSTLQVMQYDLHFIFKKFFMRRIWTLSNYESFNIAFAALKEHTVDTNEIVKMLAGATGSAPVLPVVGFYLKSLIEDKQLDLSLKQVIAVVSNSGAEALVMKQRVMTSLANDKDLQLDSDQVAAATSRSGKKSLEEVGGTLLNLKTNKNLSTAEAVALISNNGNSSAALLNKGFYFDRLMALPNMTQDKVVKLLKGPGAPSTAQSMLENSIIFLRENKFTEDQIFERLLTNDNKGSASQTNLLICVAEMLQEHFSCEDITKLLEYRRSLNSSHLVAIKNYSIAEFRKSKHLPKNKRMQLIVDKVVSAKINRTSITGKLSSDLLNLLKV